MFDMNPLKRTTGKTEDTREAEITNAPPAPRTSPSERVRSLATIGPSIHIKGELSGEEDLVIQGEVEGTINLKQNNLTIGQDGKVNAQGVEHLCKGASRSLDAGVIGSVVAYEP